MYSELDGGRNIEDNLNNLKSLLLEHFSITVAAADPHIPDLLMITKLLSENSFCHYDVYTQKHSIVVELSSLIKKE